MKDNYYSHKSKIRGWKRRVKQIDNWGEVIKQPWLNWFKDEKGQYTYERCTLSPFYCLEKRQPPIWFFKLIISKFTGAYLEWLPIFQSLGIPFDLMLKLYDPAYVRSEIISYKVAEKGEFKRFIWESDLIKEFPYEKFACQGYGLEKFEWVLADEEDIIFQSEIDYDDLDLNAYLLDGYIKKTQNGNEIYYAKRIGDIWIGRIRPMERNTKEISPSKVQPYYPLLYNDLPFTSHP